MKNLILSLIFLGALPSFAQQLKLQAESRLVLLGGGLGARMMHYGHFETALHERFPTHQLFIRNMCDEGGTPGFRPHSARNSPWAYPGAEQFRVLGTARDRWGSGHTGNGFYKSPDKWLKTLKPNLIIGFFGYSESFAGPQGLVAFKAELAGWIRHTQATVYNGKAPPQLALVSPTAFQDLSQLYDTPDGVQENVNLALYTSAMKEVAAAHRVSFVDVFSSTQQWFEASPDPLTRDGALADRCRVCQADPLSSSTESSARANEPPLPIPKRSAAQSRRRTGSGKISTRSPTESMFSVAGIGHMDQRIIPPN